MKNSLRNALIALVTFSSSAFAAGSTADSGGSLMLTLFVGFFALILVFQVVPAALMFIGMVKGLFSAKSQVRN
jgi:hypothetical protein